MRQKKFEALSRVLFTGLNTEAIKNDVLLTLDFETKTIRNVLTEKELSLEVALDQILQVDNWPEAMKFLMEEYYKILID